MLELYTIVLALCGQPKMKTCYLDALNCNRSGKQMRCTADIVIREGKKIRKQKIKVPITKEN